MFFSKNIFTIFVFSLLITTLFFNSSTNADPLLKCSNSNECRKLLENAAKNFLGAHYSYGSTGGKGFDCSGLVLAMMGKLMDKVNLPRSSQEMHRSLSQSISLKDAQMGDLLFFNTGRGISHVGIFWGRDEKGNLVMYHSSSSKGVELRKLNQDKYWMTRLVDVKRYVPVFKALNNGADKNKTIALEDKVQESKPAISNKKPKGIVNELTPKQKKVFTASEGALAYENELYLLEESLCQGKNCRKEKVSMKEGLGTLDELDELKDVEDIAMNMQ
jgi:hypothetical protein